MALTPEQIQHIYRLADNGMSGRKIAEEVGIGHKVVRTQLAARKSPVAVGTIKKIVSEPALQEAVNQNVFDITTGLQEVLQDANALVIDDEAALLRSVPHKDRVAAVQAKLAVYAQAARIAEKIYSIQTLEVVIKALIAEYEEESPDIQQRILQRLGSNPDAQRLLSLVSGSSPGAEESR